MKSLDFRDLMWDMGAATLMLLLPLLIFFKHHDYPLHRPESVLFLGLVVFAGLIFGMGMNLGRVPGRFIVTVFLAVLVVDIQTNWITTWGLRLLLNVLLFSCLFWFLRRRLSQVVLVVAGAMVIGTLVTPGRDQSRTSGSFLGESNIKSDLPFILHIILDEHIGIEGIPRQFDENQEIAEQIRDSYLDKGFRVFGRAYSTYYLTMHTIPNMLNFTFSRDANAYFRAPYKFVGKPLIQNKWFETLRERGYRIHVIQPRYMAFDHLEGSPRGPLADSSLTFHSQSINVLIPLALSAIEKSRYLMDSYQDLSFFMSLMRDGTKECRNSSLGTFLGMPPWVKGRHLPSVVSSMNVLLRLEEDLEQAGPGKVFFVHLIMPHHPYAYERDCGIQLQGNDWLLAGDKSLAPRRNDDASRALRYPLYLDQLICTNNTAQQLLENLSHKPWWNDAIVILHGDHGSRIDRGPPLVPTVEEMTAQDFMDAYATLFAIKHPEFPAGYDRRQLPVGHLFKLMVRDGRDPGNPDLENHPRALVEDGENPMVEMSLPFFDHGLPQGTSLDGQ